MHAWMNGARIQGQPPGTRANSSVVSQSLPKARDLGSCGIELVTRQLMVGNFEQPGPPQTAVERQGNLKHQGPPWVPAGT